MNMSKTIKELYRVFNLLNEALFNSELPEVQIVVMETAKSNAYGWFTPYASWTDAKGEVEKFEIALSAEYLNSKLSYDGTEQRYLKIIETLLHEMIHLYCHVNDIKDTSRQGRYHNKRFKEACEQHGMYFEIESPNATIGWSQALLTVDSQKLIESWAINPDAFKLARVIRSKTASKSSQVAYSCPSCDLKIRGKRDLNIKCGDCDETLEEGD